MRECIDCCFTPFHSVVRRTPVAVKFNSMSDLFNARRVVLSAFQTPLEQALVAVFNGGGVWLALLADFTVDFVLAIVVEDWIFLLNFFLTPVTAS